MKFLTYNKWLAVLGVAGMTTLIGCTKNFEEFNTNPTGITNDDLKADFRLVGEPFKQAQINIYTANPAWQTQLQQNLIADIYSGYMMTPTPFRGNSNNTTYDLVDGWNGFPWSIAYNNVMAPMKEVEDKTKTEFTNFGAWAKIIKVEAMHRLSDIFGPIIYTSYGKVNADGSVSYDSQQAAYNAFFSDLGAAVDTLSRYANNPALNDAAPFKNFDKVYAGDYKKWIKFANTLRLRLAVRISKADPAKAKLEAEKSLAHPMGLITTNAENFVVDFGETPHPLNVINGSWGDIRMGAPMESYLKGYGDPRGEKYFLKSIDVPGELKGIRQGIALTDKSTYVGYSALAPLANKAVLLTAAEAWLLKAEAALLGYAGAGNAQANYEAGITQSFAQHEVSSKLSAYLADGTSLPAAYTDTKNAGNSIPSGSAMLSTATIKWDESANNAVKLEKIITQKWIAMFPDGQEAWSEFRRTGFPKLFPVMVNLSGGKIPNGTFVNRINLPASEYQTNPKGVQQAASTLGGPDTGGTPLWWDK